MTRIDVVHERLRHASDLAAVLDAAYDVFEEMLSVIRAHEDSGNGMFGALVMAAGSAADGRDAILFAPSLPPHRLCSADERDQHVTAATASAVDALVGLSELLAAQLDGAARAAPDPADRTACLDAARWARDVHGLLMGTGP